MPTTVLTNGGRDAVRDALQSEIAELAVGTDATDPTVSDTALGIEVISKATTEGDDGTGVATFSIRLDTTEANGSDLAEIGAVDGSGTLLSRLVFAEIAKTSDFELEFVVRKTVQNTSS